MLPIGAAGKSWTVSKSPWNLTFFTSAASCSLICPYPPALNNTSMSFLPIPWKFHSSHCFPAWMVPHLPLHLVIFHLCNSQLLSLVFKEIFLISPWDPVSYKILAKCTYSSFIVLSESNYVVTCDRLDYCSIHFRLHCLTVDRIYFPPH